MSKITKLIMISFILVFSISMVAKAGIVRVAKRLNVIEFYGGYAKAVGKYDHIDIINFTNSLGQLVELDADDVYEPTYYFGFNYGQLRNDHIYFSIGFHYTKIETKDVFYTEPDFGWSFDPETPNFNQYDIDFNLNYYLNNPSSAIFSPYIGAGFHGGVTSVTGDKIDIESDNYVTLALGVNFGADLTVWTSSDDRSLVTLSSVNEYQFVASEDRPKYLTIGLGLKYYFRP